MSINEEVINFALGRAEALILFEMLSDFYSQPNLEVNDSAERLALVRLHGVLEKVLVEPFMPAYRAQIEEARSRLVTQFGGA